MERAAVSVGLPIGLPLQISSLAAKFSGLVTQLASNLFPDKIFEAEKETQQNLKWNQQNRSIRR